jgi:hypothetical protein
VQSGPIQGDWQGRSGLRGPNTFTWSERERRPTNGKPQDTATGRRVVQSGPIQGSCQGRSGLRGPNMFAWSERERRPTERAGKRPAPPRGGPPLAFRSCKRFVPWCASRQSAPPRDGPLWTTLQAAPPIADHKTPPQAVGWCRAAQSGAIGRAEAVYGDQTCLHGQNASAAPPSARVNVQRRLVVGRRSRFGDADVSSHGARLGNPLRRGMGRSGPPYKPPRQW